MSLMSSRLTSQCGLIPLCTTQRQVSDANIAIFFLNEYEYRVSVSFCIQDTHHFTAGFCHVIGDLHGNEFQKVTLNYNITKQQVKVFNHLSDYLRL